MNFNSKQLFLVLGDIGSGKTTFSKKFCERNRIIYLERDAFMFGLAPYLGDREEESVLAKELFLQSLEEFMKLGKPILCEGSFMI